MKTMSLFSKTNVTVKTTCDNKTNKYVQTASASQVDVFQRLAVSSGTWAPLRTKPDQIHCSVVLSLNLPLWAHHTIDKHLPLRFSHAKRHVRLPRSGAGQAFSLPLPWATRSCVCGCCRVTNKTGLRWIKCRFASFAAFNMPLRRISFMTHVRRGQETFESRPIS